MHWFSPGIRTCLNRLMCETRAAHPEPSANLHGQREELNRKPCIGKRSKDAEGRKSAFIGEKRNSCNLRRYRRKGLQGPFLLLCGIRSALVTPICASTTLSGPRGCRLCLPRPRRRLILLLWNRTCPARNTATLHESGDSCSRWTRHLDPSLATHAPQSVCAGGDWRGSRHTGSKFYRRPRTQVRRRN